MAFCSTCGEELKDGVKFCENCGARVEAPETENRKDTTSSVSSPENKKTKKKSKFKQGCLIAAISVFFLFLLFLVCGHCIGRMDEKKANEPVSVKKISGARCIATQATFRVDTSETTMLRKDVHEKEVVYRWKDTLSEAGIEKFNKEAEKLLDEGIQEFKGNNFTKAKKIFNRAREKIKDKSKVDVWLEKVNDKIQAQNKREEAERKKKKAAKEKEIEKSTAGARKEYESLLRTNFLDKGLDIKVKVYGTNNTYISLTYVLIDDVWVHHFKKGDLIDEIREMGFKRVYFKDGHDYSQYIYWKND
jgi:hypothetical protein